MVTKYEIGCGCGRTVQVESRQAGESLECACGRSIHVPTLRGLSQLPQVQQQEAAGRGWTRTQGICFLAGVVWLALGSVITWQFWSRAVRPVEIQKFDRIAADFSSRVDRLTPSESFTYWRMFRDQPTGMLTSEERSRQVGTGNSRYLWLAWGAGGLTIIGAAGFVAGMALARRRNNPIAQGRKRSEPV